MVVQQTRMRGEQKRPHVCSAALGELPRLHLLPLSEDHHAAVLERLERLRGHTLTYVDASSLVFLRALRIAEVWGTDWDLALEGARVIPVGR